MMWINLGILVGLFTFGFLIGRLKKQDAYDQRIKNLEADKEYWRGIANRKQPEVPSEPTSRS